MSAASVLVQTVPPGSTPTAVVPSSAQATTCSSGAPSIVDQKQPPPVERSSPCCVVASTWSPSGVAASACGPAGMASCSQVLPSALGRQRPVGAEDAGVAANGEGVEVDWPAREIGVQVWPPSVDPISPT